MSVTRSRDSTAATRSVRQVCGDKPRDVRAWLAPRRCRRPWRMSRLA
jgi:hypothetical protein